jgi:nitrogen regulatory protein PII
MKEISVFIRTDDLTQVNKIIRKHDAGGISFHEINGGAAGRDKRDAIQEIVEAYTTRRSIITDYEKRTKDEIIVPDWRFILRQTELEVFAN